MLIALLVLFFGIDYLKGINVFKAANYYYVSYTNVNGLTVSSPVTINGFKVGQVRDINYEYDNPGHVLVELSLDKKLKVPSGSKAIIKSDLLGTASVELQFSTSADSHDVGDKLIGEAMPSMLDNVASELMPTVSSIFPKVDSLLTSVNRLITANLEATTVNLNRTLATMPKVMTTVDGVALNLDTITANLALVSQELKEMPIESTLQNVHDITADMKVLAGKLNSTDNSLGLLLNDRGLYDHLNGAAGGLDSLLFDVKKNPKRYIPPIKVF